MGLPRFDFFSFSPRFFACISPLPLPPKRTLDSLKRILNAFAPIEEKLSFKLWFIASMAVMIPINAMIPKAMMATVMPVRSLLLRTVRHASDKESKVVMQIVFQPDKDKRDYPTPPFRSYKNEERLKIEPVQYQRREKAEQNDQCGYQ